MKSLRRWLTRGSKHVYKEFPYPPDLFQHPTSGPVPLHEIKKGLWTYNPMGKARRPVRPIVFLCGPSTQSTAIYHNILRHMNYPYGAAIIEWPTNLKTEQNMGIENTIQRLGLENIPNPVAQYQDELGGLGRPNSTKSPRLKKKTYSKQQKKSVSSSHPTLEQLRQHYYDCLADLHIEHPAWVVANEMAGLVAFSAAKEQPWSVTGMTLINSTLHQIHHTYKKQWNGEREFRFEESQYYQLSEEQLLELRSSRDRSILHRSMHHVEDATTLRDSLKSLKGKESELLKLSKLYEEEFRRMFFTPEDLYEVRHPIALVTSRYGIPEPNSRTTTPIIPPNLIYYHLHTQNIRRILTAPNLNHYELMISHQYASKIAKLTESLLAPYDTHRNIQETFEWLRQPFSKHVPERDQPLSIHYQPSLQKKSEESKKSANDILKEQLELARAEQREKDAV